MFTRNIGSMSADPGAIFGPIQGLTEEVAIADSRPSLARGGADHLGACDGELQLACPSSCGRSLRMADPRMPNELRTFASANHFARAALWNDGFPAFTAWPERVAHRARGAGGRAGGRGFVFRCRPQGLPEGPAEHLHCRLGYR
jgi:hypothetical protein